MPSRAAIFVRGNYYHLYNRGVGKSLLFFNDDNYLYCLRLIKRNAQKFGVQVVAYCLMPNHYHFLLRQDSDVPLSKFINVLFNAYVQAVNRQQNRKGALFEGRFRHALVDRDEYLIHLSRYIHLNPRKANLVSNLDDWPYSNYLEWVGERSGTLIDLDVVRQYFPTPGLYREFVLQGPIEIESVNRIRRYIWD